MAVGVAVVAVPGTASAHTSRPSEPTGLHVVRVTDTSFTVAMNPASHAKRYRLFASTVRSNMFTKNISRAHKSQLSPSPRVAINGLPRTSAPYYYRVEALNGPRAKFSSTIGEVGLRPAPPAHVRATSSSAKTYVTWNGGGASGFTVEQATDPGMTKHQKIYTVHGDANQLTPYSLSTGRKYYFRVRSLNQATPSSYSSTTQTVVQTGQQFARVMTYNIKKSSLDGQAEGGSRVAPWTSKRKAAVARLIRRASPDVAGIEEAGSWVGRREGARQIDTLRQALGGEYSLAHTEVPPSQPGTKRTGDYILYKTATYQAVGRGGHWNVGDSRWGVHQILRNRQTGAKFLFVTTHLWDASGRAGDIKREHETEQLVSDGNALAARHGIPVVYVGDFNSDSFGNHAFNAATRVMKRNHIADAFNVAQVHARAGYNTANHYMRRPPHVGARIDYVFAPPGVGVKSWKLIMRLRHGRYVGTIPSDHNPLAADITIPYRAG
jgi:endonuclease/exonuclease/phosphatase family metal-dependent hydrolase